jgi:hypothetical protein
VSPLKYFQTIRQGLRTIPDDSQFATILFDFNFKEKFIPMLSEYQKFENYLTDFYDSRAYLSSPNKYCD